jgi:hypothetical protein
VTGQTERELLKPLMRVVGRALGLVVGALGALDEDLPAEAFGLAREAFGVGAYAVGTVADEEYPRMMGLRGTAELALRLGDLDRAASLARELLAIAEHYRTDFDYGNAVHHGHLILGLVALRRGDRVTAGQELLAAGHTPGSPQLSSFGPNMKLARDLLKAGEREVVLRYFEECATFWKIVPNPLATWTEAVRAGGVPDFKANLLY